MEKQRENFKEVATNGNSEMVSSTIEKKWKGLKKIVFFMFFWVILIVSVNSYGQELIRDMGSGGYWGYVDKSSRSVVIPHRYVETKDFSEGLAAVRKYYGGWGFIDQKGEEIIPFDFQKVRSFSEGLAAVKLKGKWGFIDKIGYCVIPFDYEEVGDFSSGYTTVRYDKFWGAIDKNGTEIVPCIYKDIPSVNAAILRISEQNKNQVVVNQPAETKQSEPIINNAQEVVNSTTTISYDVILLKNGQEIKAKVTEITPSEIKYKLFEHLDGPTRTMAKSDAFVIIYANGTREVISPIAEINTSSTNNKIPKETKGVPNRAGEVSIGISPILNTLPKNIILTFFGLCGKMQVGIANPIRLEGSFTYYLHRNIKLGTPLGWVNIKYNVWDVNLNMQMIFTKLTKDDKFISYPLIGLAVSNVKASVLGYGAEKPFFCMNAGFGFDVKLSNKLFFNSEVKEQFAFIKKDGVGSRTMFSAGLILRF